MTCPKVSSYAALYIERCSESRATGRRNLAPCRGSAKHCGTARWRNVLPTGKCQGDDRMGSVSCPDHGISGITIKRALAWRA